MNPRQRKKHYVRWLIVIIVLAFGGFMYLRPLPALYPINNLQANDQVRPAKLAWPSGAQESAIGATGYGVLSTNGAQTMRPTASTAKLITALSVLGKYPLAPGQSGPTIILGKADVALYNKYLAEQGSVAKVAAGEKISEYQVLQGMMLPSANNLADSLAIWAYGSLSAYKAAADNFIKSLGLSDTQLGPDASGFAPGTLSTAHDLVIIGETALQNPVLAQIVGQSQATLPVAGKVKNVNWLLGQDGIVGIKTGNSAQAGGVYIFASNYAVDASHKVTIVGALQGSTSLQAAMDDAVPLLTSAEQNFSLVSVARAGQIVAHYNVPWSSPVNAIATARIDEVAWAGQPAKPIFALHALYAPQKSGAAAGSISSPVSGNSSTVVLQHAIVSPPWWWRLVRYKL